jgi:hypothetical protein
LVWEERREKWEEEEGWGVRCGGGDVRVPITTEAEVQLSTSKKIPREA